MSARGRRSGGGGKERSKTASQLTDFASGKRVPDRLTTSQGCPVDHGDRTMTIGERGPIPLQDFTFLDTLSHFDRERIPERVVHAKGAGAFGYFEVTHDITRYCKAKLFSAVGKRTPIAVRFSTVGGESGSADTVRDPRGFAIKFYTEDGNWDLVGNNTPIFFIRDPILFPSFIHTQKRNPQTHLKDMDMFWDFITLRPESTHQVSFLFSDRGIPDGYRHMNGYGSHTFKLVDSDGHPVYCKFHYKTNQGIKNLSVSRAAQLAGDDPDYSLRDLFEAIANRNYPSWTLYIQVMTFEQAEKHQWNPFDLTKVWPHSEFPLVPVGRLVLERNPTNYFAEVEQMAFSPAHLVEGIEPSPDKMLQGRLFSYVDTHRHRLGANYHQIPVNCPYSARPAHYLRDGPMTVDSNQGQAPNYFPNSFSGPSDSPSCAISKTTVVTGDVKRYKTADDDNFTQVTTFWSRVLLTGERERLVQNIARSASGAADFIQRRVVHNFTMVHPDCGQAIARLLEQYQTSSRL